MGKHECPTTYLVSEVVLLFQKMALLASRTICQQRWSTLLSCDPCPLTASVSRVPLSGAALSEPPDHNERVDLSDDPRGNRVVE
jgi:hypothetical protein